MNGGEEHDDDPTRPRADPNDPYSPPAGPADPTIQRAQDGLRLWEQIKQIEPRDRALVAIAGLEDDDLRAIVTHQLFAWHAALDKKAAEDYWREQEGDDRTRGAGRPEPLDPSSRLSVTAPPTGGQPQATVTR